MEKMHKFQIVSGNGSTAFFEISDKDLKATGDAEFEAEDELGVLVLEMLRTLVAE